MSSNPGDFSSQDATELLTRSSLIHGLKTFSKDRWTNFVLVYAPLLKYWIRQKRVPDSAADDVLQDSLQSICSSIDTFQRDKTKGKFRGWLRTIVERRIADHFRMQPIEIPTSPEQLGNIPTPKQKNAAVLEEEQRVIEEIRARAMELVRRSTTEKTWQMFWMSTVDQIPTSEIAKQFDVSSAAVRVAKQRVLHRLRILMLEDLDKPSDPPTSENV
jgi:RNA polymerase sigma-70 factor (ECF subfamily)